jgi:hypothetical protein
VLWESKYLNNFVRFGREAKANDYNNYWTYIIIVRIF